jgi:hypothetical protein
MSNLVNLQRDQLWFQTSSNISWPSTIGRLNSSGIVNDNLATYYGSSTTSTTQTNLGVMIQQPTGENTPYRVKLYALSSSGVYLRVGYATTQTGTNDTIGDSEVIPVPKFGSAAYLDEVINVEATSGADPLFFAVYSSGSGIAIDIALSVQRLNVTVPRYSSVVS